MWRCLKTADLYLYLNALTSSGDVSIAWIWKQLWRLIHPFRDITVKKLKISHPNAGLKWFASRNIVRGEVLRYYFYSPVYANLTKQRHKTKKYWKGVMQVTAKIFRKWPNGLPERVMDKDANEHKIWIDPASSSTMRYIYDARCVPEDTTSET